MLLGNGELVVLERPDGSMEDVPNVLVQQADLSDQSIMDVQTRFINQARYKGDSETLTLNWPKACPGNLVDCHVWVRNNRYRVYGSPMEYDNKVCPTDWNRQVTVNRPIFMYKGYLLSVDETQDEWGVTHRKFIPREVETNLLRNSDEGENTAGIFEGMQAIMMFEFRNEDYNGELYFKYDGVRYLVTGRATAPDTVVLVCRSDVAHGASF